MLLDASPAIATALDPRRLPAPRVHGQIPLDELQDCRLRLWRVRMRKATFGFFVRNDMRRMCVRSSRAAVSIKHFRVNC